MKTVVFILLFAVKAVATSPPVPPLPPSIEEIKARAFLDDYYSNVVHGYNIVMDTPKYAKRYVGNDMKCTHCHRNGGTEKEGLPLNVAGIYPQWRSKNGKRNGLSLRIRECFFYSHNGVMPSNDAPEVQAIAAYISYLSQGEIIGQAPEGRGSPVLSRTGFDPNPVSGGVVYRQKCVSCHGVDGQGSAQFPALWGWNSYNQGAGMNNIQKAAGYIWANMPLGEGKSLTHQEALDIAAFLNAQVRPPDPRKGKLLLLLGKVLPRSFFSSTSEP